MSHTTTRHRPNASRAAQPDYEGLSQLPGRCDIRLERLNGTAAELSRTAQHIDELLHPVKYEGRTFLFAYVTSATSGQVLVFRETHT